MWEDPIVKKPRAAREECLERFNFDLDAYAHISMKSVARREEAR